VDDLNLHNHPFPNIFHADCAQCIAVQIARRDKGVDELRKTNLSDDQYGEMQDYGVGVAKAAASRDRNEEYGVTGTEHEYKPEDIDIDSVPLTRDLVQFVYWLRKHTDFFSGPNLDMHFPDVNNPDFDDVLGDLAIIYTGE
jgi:hypothetical protein